MAQVTFDQALESAGATQPSPFLAALAKAPPPKAAPLDPSQGAGELDLWNPFGKNIDTGVSTPQWLNRTLAGTGQGMESAVRHAGNLVGLESNKDLTQAAAR